MIRVCRGYLICLYVNGRKDIQREFVPSGFSIYLNNLSFNLFLFFFSSFQIVSSCDIDLLITACLLAIRVTSLKISSRMKKVCGVEKEGK
jgi:hypothetical protein